MTRKANYTLLNPSFLNNSSNKTYATDFSDSIFFRAAPFRPNINLAAWSTNNGNGYTAIKAQLVNDSLVGLAEAQQLMRFKSISELGIATFSDGSSLIAVSVKIPKKNYTSILTTYSSHKNKQKLFHIYPTLNGKFEIVTRSTPEKTYKISYMRNETAFNVREYKFIDTQNVSLTNHTIINPQSKCNTGCDLNSPELNDLMIYNGGYINPNISSAFFPINGNRQTRSIESSTFPVLGVHPKYFYNKNLSLITTIHNATDHLVINTQFIDIINASARGANYPLGNFSEIYNIYSSGFNESSVLIAYSTKKDSIGNYNIVVQYLSPTVSKIYNLFTNIKGEFKIDVVPKSSDFVIAYFLNSTVIKIAKYSIIPNNNNNISIQEIFTVPSIQSSTSIFHIDLKAYEDNTCNLIHSSYNNSNIIVSRYSLNDGSKISEHFIPLQNTSTLAPDYILVDTDNKNSSLLAWQENEYFAYATILKNYNISNFNAVKISGNNTELERIKFINDHFFSIGLLLINSTNASDTLLHKKYIFADNGTKILELNYEYASNGTLLPISGEIISD